MLGGQRQLARRVALGILSVRRIPWVQFASSVLKASPDVCRLAPRFASSLGVASQLLIRCDQEKLPGCSGPRYLLRLPALLQPPIDRLDAGVVASSRRGQSIEEQF